MYAGDLRQTGGGAAYAGDLRLTGGGGLLMPVT